MFVFRVADAHQRVANWTQFALKWLSRSELLLRAVGGERDGESRLVGVVEDFEPIPANTCLYVRKSSGEQIMLPLHEDFIINIDAEARSVALRLPEGL